jgi:hypothetical protein
VVLKVWRKKKLHRKAAVRSDNSRKRKTRLSHKQSFTTISGLCFQRNFHHKAGSISCFIDPPAVRSARIWHGSWSAQHRCTVLVEHDNFSRYVGHAFFALGNLLHCCACFIAQSALRAYLEDRPVCGDRRANRRADRRVCPGAGLAGASDRL